MVATASPLSPAPARRATGLAALAIVLAALVAYANTLSAPLIFDDLPAIVGNPTLHSFAAALAPPRDGSNVTGRPLVNLSLAFNHALSGQNVWSYHALNLAIHALAGLALFGVARRTFAQPTLRETFGAVALPLGAAVALIWTLHPLQTESVTCIVQRTESLAALFYLLTLYGFIRGWRWLAVAAALAGVATKEILVTVPVMLWLYDRTFVAGSFRAAWEQRWRTYALVAASWLPLAWLVAGEAGSRGNAEGAAASATIHHYLLTQCGALVHYLRLAAWPQPLVLDYDTRLVTHVADALLPGCALLALLALTAFGLWRRPVAGFVGAWFFLILAPSSSVVPLLPQPIAEHRMYLPLAGLVAAAVALAFRTLGRRIWFVVGASAVTFGALTIRRNATYHSAESIWRDTVAHQPNNARAHFYLGYALENAGRRAEAIAAYESALARHPDYAEAHANLGRVQGEAGDFARAIEHLSRAAQLDAKLLVARKNLGLYLSFAGRGGEAIDVLTSYIAAQPGDAEAQTWLGDAWMRQAQPARAVPCYATAVQLTPGADKAETNWSAACLQLNQPAEALRHGERALQLNATGVEPHKNVALALVLLGRDADAAEHFRAVLRAAPDDAVAREQLTRINGRRP